MTPFNKLKFGSDVAAAGAAPNGACIDALKTLQLVLCGEAGTPQSVRLLSTHSEC
jgi:hypothetical protein